MEFLIRYLLLCQTSIRSAWIQTPYHFCSQRVGIHFPLKTLFAKFVVHTVTHASRKVCDHYFVSRNPMPFSLVLWCKVPTHVMTKQSPSPPRRYISPKPDNHFPHRTPLCKRTGCAYKGEGCETQRSRR
ncbi:unnamed protein product [Ascophyllum nodosum]